jgi:hypothetical protein
MFLKVGTQRKWWDGPPGCARVPVCGLARHKSTRFTSRQKLLAEQAVENIRLEFKRDVPNKHKVLKKLSSFADTSR